MIEKRIDGTKLAPWLRCRGCHKAFFAGGWHCKRCHETFESVADWHWVDGGCVPAVRMGWREEDGVWRP